jgi:hypothetical protein
MKEEGVRYSKITISYVNDWLRIKDRSNTNRRCGDNDSGDPSADLYTSERDV